MGLTVIICYLVNIIFDIILIFLTSINVIEFDEIKTSKKNPVEQCNLLNPLVSPWTLSRRGVDLYFLVGGLKHIIQIEGIYIPGLYHLVIMYYFLECKKERKITYV